MTQFVYHLIYIIKDKINNTSTQNQPYNMTTHPEKVKNIKKETSKKQNINDEIMELMFSIHD